MRNRAKCRLCKAVIESYHLGDYVTCKCGEISIDGGLQELLVYAKDFGNVIRVDDAGNEIIPRVENDIIAAKPVCEGISKPDFNALIGMLDEMIASYERLPQHAMTQPVSNYDLLSSLLLVAALFKVLRID